jgi:hypothetical protein
MGEKPLSPERIPVHRQTQVCVKSPGCAGGIDLLSRIGRQCGAKLIAGRSLPLARSTHETLLSPTKNDSLPPLLDLIRA